MHIGGGVGFV